MTKPRHRYLGCLATKIQPEDYEDCLENYDNPDYDNIGLVPSRLHQRVYENGDDKTKGLLGPTIENKSFSDLPTGLKHYMSSHPSEFKNYYNQRRHELGLMRSVLRNLGPREKQILREYYSRNKSLDHKKMSELLHPSSPSSSSSSSSSSSTSSRKRRTRGGGRDWETESTVSSVRPPSEIASHIEWGYQDNESVVSGSSNGTSFTSIIK